MEMRIASSDYLRDVGIDYTQGAIPVPPGNRNLRSPGARRTDKFVVGYFELRPLGPTKVKGVSARFGVSRARGLSRFVEGAHGSVTIAAHKREHVGVAATGLRAASGNPRGSI